METLKCRCPLNLGIINLDEEITENFKVMLQKIEEKEDEEILKILEDRKTSKFTKGIPMSEIYEYENRFTSSEEFEGLLDEGRDTESE